MIVAVAMVVAIVPAFTLTAAAVAGEQSISATNAYSMNSSDVKEDDLSVIGENSMSKRITLIGFDVPNLEENEIITKAELVLTVKDVTNGDSTITVDDASTIWTKKSSTITWQESGSDISLPSVTEFGVTSGDKGKTIVIDVTDYVATKAGDFASFRLRNFTPKSGNKSNIVKFYNTSDDAHAPKLNISIKEKASITVNFKTKSGEPLNTEMLQGYVGDTYTYTNSVNDNYAIIEKDGSDGNFGYIAEILESNPTEVVSGGIEVDVIVAPKYKLKSKNLLPDGEDGLDQYTVGSGTAGNYTTQILSAGGNLRKTDEKAHSGSNSIKTTNNGWGAGDSLWSWYGSNSLVMYREVNANSKYYFAGSFFPGAARGTQATIATLAAANDPTSMQGIEDGADEPGGGKILSNGGVTSWNGLELTKSSGTGTNNNKSWPGNEDGGKLFPNMTGKWNQLEYELTTDANSKGFMAAFYYTLDCGTSFFDDFMLYEVEDYADELESIEKANITVIEGNDPILPKKLTGHTKNGLAVNVDIDWDLGSVDFTNANSPVTVNGHAHDETGVAAEATVTVLPNTFEMGNITSVSCKQGEYAGKAHKFPKNIVFAKDFSVEFDYKVNSIADASIQVCKDGAIFGDGAVAIGIGGALLNVTSGKGLTDSSRVSTNLFTVAVGEQYRVLINIKTEEKMFNVTVTKPDGTSYSTEDVYFRNCGKHDVINTIGALSNSESGNTADGDIEMLNIKIYDANYKEFKALAPELAWTGEDFAINFLFGDDADDGTYTINVTKKNAETKEFTETVNNTATVEVNDTVKGFTLNGKSNDIYKAEAVNGDVVTADMTNGVSVYGLVMKALSELTLADGDKILAEQIDAVNKVVNDGGLYIKDGALPIEAVGILSYDSAENTVTINDKLFNAGLKFEMVKYTSGEDVDKDATIEDAGKTAKLSSAMSAGLDEIFLSEIEFVFEPGEVAEEADEAGTIDFVEEI